MFPEGDFPKISSCFLTFFEKIEQKKTSGLSQVVFKDLCKFFIKIT